MSHDPHLPDTSGENTPRTTAEDPSTVRTDDDGATRTETERDTGNGLAIAAIVFGIGAVAFAPIILGPIGIVLAVMARNRGQSLGTAALWITIAGTVVGLVLGLLAAQMMVNEGMIEEALAALS